VVAEEVVKETLEDQKAVETVKEDPQLLHLLPTLQLQFLLLPMLEQWEYCQLSSLVTEPKHKIF
jgi:hypothetical protein